MRFLPRRRAESPGGDAEPAGAHGATEGPIVTAAEVLAWRRRVGRGPTFRPPGLVIVTFHAPLLGVVRRRYGASSRRGLSGEFLVVGRRGHGVGVLGPHGVGAPAFAIPIEELAALGVRRVVAIGQAGTLVRDLAPGDVVLVTAALPGDGVSAHYGANRGRSVPDAALSDTFARALHAGGVQFRRGITWTTDALYRETRAEAAEARRQGAVVVDMEVAALFAVGGDLGVATAAALVVADSLADDRWRPPDDPRVCEAALLRVLEAALDLRP